MKRGRVNRALSPTGALLRPLAFLSLSVSARAPTHFPEICGCRGTRRRKSTLPAPQTLQRNAQQKL